MGCAGFACSFYVRIYFLGTYNTTDCSLYYDYYYCILVLLGVLFVVGFWLSLLPFVVGVVVAAVIFLFVLIQKRGEEERKEGRRSRQGQKKYTRGCYKGNVVVGDIYRSPPLILHVRFFGDENAWHWCGINFAVIMWPSGCILGTSPGSSKKRSRGDHNK